MLERLKEAVKKETFTSSEKIEFKENYELSLLAGVTIGYKLAMEDFKKIIISDSKQISQN